MLTAQQSQRYFEQRLSGHRFSGRGAEQKTHCPFHDDRTPSFSANFEKGTWCCHAGCGSGGILDFEERFSKCDRETATKTVASIVGEKVFGGGSEQPVAVYQYHDAQGKLAFEKLRFEPKRFLQRKPNGKGYDYKLGDIRKPLYRLPEVLESRYIIICEGEKDCDNVLAALKGKGVAATTNFDGAGKWRDEDSIYLAGKQVVIVVDNDEIGRKHGNRVAASVYPYAVGVRIVTLPGLDDHGDASDYLAAGHSGEELLQEMKTAPQWYPSKEVQKLFVSAPAFVAQVPEHIDWMVDKVIERGANGFFAANPKTGKSWAAVDLAISLALGSDWLGFSIPRPVKVALISREDNPGLTAWRIKHLFASKESRNAGLLESHLYVNSRRQSHQLMLDNAEQLEELAKAMKAFGAEFAIFDVFNVLHSADENDNSEMRRVLQRLSQLQAEVGCGIGVVHHYSKANDPGLPLTQRLRGAGAIAGWCEWLIGMSMADLQAKIRCMEFDIKADNPPSPVYFTIDSSEDQSWAKLTRVDYAPSGARKQPTAAGYMQ
jgi:hypothetical protein